MDVRILTKQMKLLTNLLNDSPSKIDPDRWQQFALVHTGTAAAARIRWYLDYELAGEIFLGHLVVLEAQRLDAVGDDGPLFPTHGRCPGGRGRGP